MGQAQNHHPSFSFPSISLFGLTGGPVGLQMNRKRGKKEIRDRKEIGDGPCRTWTELKKEKKN